jgi:hypothetical protein
MAESKDEGINETNKEGVSIRIRLAKANEVLNTHVEYKGLCSRCSVRWPCPKVLEAQRLVQDSQKPERSDG